MKIKKKQLFTVILMAGFAFAAPLYAELIAHYTFDGEVDGATPDSVGSNEAVLGDRVLINTGAGVAKVGAGALEMLGGGSPGPVDGAISSNTFSWVAGQTTTMVFWLKSTGPRSGQGTFVSIGTNNAYGSRIDVKENGIYALFTEFNGFEMTVPTVPDVEDGNWHFVAVVAPQGGFGSDAALYVDGGTTNLNTGSPDTTHPIATYEGPLVFGDSVLPATIPVSDRTPEAMIDDFQLYDEALSLEEIQQLYENPGLTLVTPTISEYSSVITALDLLPATLSATITGDPDQITSLSFMLMTDDFEFPAGANASVTDMTTDNQYPTAILTTDKPGIYKVKLNLSDGITMREEIAEIVVYSDSCQAGKEFSGDWTANYFDLDGNCLVDILDFAEFAAKWLDDTRMKTAVPFTPIAEDKIQYVVIEGGGPDQGPGRDIAQNFNEILSEFGPVDVSKTRMYASGVQQIRILTRSTAVIRNRVESALAMADQLGVPVWLHIDPMYAWGADTETDPADAPRIKYWEEPDMREWREFPSNGQLPTYIPRKWFNWGPWCTPVSAAPAIGAPDFVQFACEQLREGVLQPLQSYLNKWRKEQREYLFAGINIGWETSITYYSSNYLNSSIVAEYPSYLAGLPVDSGLIGVSSQFGYASLHWNGWTQAGLQNAANIDGMTYDERLKYELYMYIHDYMESLAGECNNIGIGPERVYTHIVALTSIPTQPVHTTHPPIWTAVNPYSTPGFTMFNRGGAKYNMTSLKDQIASASGSCGQKFGCVETYLTNAGTEFITDPEEFKNEMEGMFSDGARVMCFYGSCPIAQRLSDNGADAIRMWLNE